MEQRLRPRRAERVESAGWYCKAVLRYEHRYDLNGEVTEEIVDDRAREQAQQKLAARAARLLAQPGPAEKAGAKDADA